MKEGRWPWGESSAQLRRLGVGDTITFEGGFEAVVAAVVPDAAVAFAEVVMADVSLFADDNTIDRYALVDYFGTQDELERAIERQLPPDLAVRARPRQPGTGHTAWAVQPQVRVKEALGEFAYVPPANGSRFDIDPDWLEANIVVVELPLLGRTPCHRVFVARLEPVLQSLIDDGLEDIIDPAAFFGCFNPRLIAGTTRISRHAFGAAADINFGNDLTVGPGSPVHPELLSRMEAAGITSGHGWNFPDPGHFELYEFE